MDTSLLLWHLACTSSEITWTKTLDAGPRAAGPTQVQPRLLQAPSGMCCGPKMCHFELRSAAVTPMLLPTLCPNPDTAALLHQLG